MPEINSLLDMGETPEQENLQYSFAALDPRSIPHALETNERVFQNPVGVLGMEVTVPRLAEQCGLGNIDPQHTGGNPNQAAIEAALTVDIPPTGATFATVRADLDSIGAMAVLVLRTSNVWFEENEGLQKRIQQVAESDRFARGGWPGKQSLPTLENPWSDNAIASVEGNRELAAIAAAVSDFKVPLDQRVRVMKKWLQTGEEPEGYREKVEAERMDMIRALESGEIQIVTTEDGKIAQITSTHRAAMAVGYTQAPIVVAQNPEFPAQARGKINKFTVAQFEEGYVDIKSVLEELNKLEEGWGGSPTIIGSPQGISSTLSQADVIQVVQQHTLK